ncbi:hypothetical protein HOM50_03885 [bacterium]|jgi:ankyrin repeat protein|nr:hypothetical protein [bacterium]MBT5015519.1 hypothetical protein [bacterium]
MKTTIRLLVTFYLLIFNNPIHTQIQPNSFVFKALDNNDFSTIKSFIANEGNPNILDDLSWPLLNRAIDQGSIEIVELLVESGAVVNNNKQDRNGSTALIVAAQKGSLIIIQYLLAHGANISMGDRNQRTALWWAVHHEYFTLARYLVEHGADVNARDCRNVSALQWAARHHNAPMATYLIENGAEVQLDFMSDPRIALPLTSFVSANNLDMVIYLAEHGAGNRDIQQGLKRALCNNFEAIATYLQSKIDKKTA